MMICDPMDLPERIDIVTHFFPPLGGPASIRLQAWARHFASRGVAVRAVVPSPRPADPYFDEGLAAPPGVEVLRVRGIDLARLPRRATRGHHLMVTLRDMLEWPDHRRIWNRPALTALLRLAPAPRVVITTSPYRSTHLIGLALKQRLPGVFWVADFRDPWLRRSRETRHAPLQRAYLLALEGRVVRAADLIVCTHRFGLEGMAARVGAAALRGRSMVVHHGVESEIAEALAALPRPPASGPLIVTFAGTIWEFNLPPGLFAAWGRFREAAGNGVELHFYGRIEPGPWAAIEAARRASPAAVHVHGPRPRGEVLAALGRSAALLVFNGPFRETVSSKLYECVAAGRPILHCGAPDSAGASVLRELGAAASVARSYDERGVADLFERFAAALAGGDVSAFVPAGLPPELRSEAQAETLLQRIAVSPGVTPRAPGSADRR